MNNASKALVIAGGILITVLIISLAMYIRTYSMSASADNLSLINQQQIDVFNSKFTQYGSASENIIVQGSDVWNILSFVRESKGNNDSVGFDIHCSSASTINDENFEKKLFFMDAMSKEKKYTYRYEYGSNGIVNEVTINY